MALPCPLPERLSFAGQWSRLEPIGPAHLNKLWAACKDAAHSFSHIRYGFYAGIVAVSAQITDLARRPHQSFRIMPPAQDGTAKVRRSACDIAPATAANPVGPVWFTPGCTPPAHARLARWLHPSNFDPGGTTLQHMETQ